MSKMITSTFLTQLTFKPFDRAMWEGFQGCESPIPFYAEYTDENEAEWLVILDGASCEVWDEHGFLADRCVDIKQLP